MLPRKTALAVALALSPSLGCDDHGTPVGPELRVLDFRLSGAVSELTSSALASPPPDIRLGDPMSVTVHYRPIESVAGFTEPTVSSFGFGSDADAWVNVTIGDHVWQMSLREIVLHDDHHGISDGIEVTAGRKAAEPTHVSVLFWDDVLPLHLLGDTSLPVVARDLDLASMTGSRITLGTWFNGGAFWFIKGTLTP